VRFDLLGDVLTDKSHDLAGDPLIARMLPDERRYLRDYR
jgi:hypothetical protein